MLLFEKIKIKCGGFVLFCSLWLLEGCVARQQEAVDLKPHVNKLVLQVNDVVNQLYDFETRLRALESQQTQVPDHVKRLADLELKLDQLSDKMQAYLTVEQENESRWKTFDQKIQNLHQELQRESKRLQTIQEENIKRAEELSSSGVVPSGVTPPGTTPPGVMPSEEGAQKEVKSSGLPALSSSPSERTSAVEPISGEDKVYNDAHKTFEDGNFPMAREKFQTFLSLYPTSDLADNAQFWIGESFYKQGNYEQSILEYEKVIQNYSKADKVAPALLKQGLAFYSLGRVKEAGILFEQVIRKAPQSDQAKIAKKKLEDIKQGKKIITK